MALYTALPQAQAQTAAPTESVHQYAIPPSPLSVALSAWGAQSGRQVVFAPELAAGKQSRGVSGSYSDEEALVKLLDGTGLAPERANAATYTLKPDPPASPQEASGPNPDRNQVTEQVSSNDQVSQATMLRTVEVSASRIGRPDLAIPTPQVPIPREALNLEVHLNVGAALLELPYFRGGSRPQNGGANNGGNTGVDLRGLGLARTLTLLDGQRFVGDNNLSNVPSILIKRVDVVTGGASATWGSDAVAGVVNIILDHDLRGVKLDTAVGISSEHDAIQRKASLAAGTDYANGAGHVIFGIDYLTRGIVSAGPSEARRDPPRWGIVPIAPGISSLLPDTGNINHAPGGTITSGILKGQVFNPDGTLSPNPYGPPISGATSSGYGAPNIFSTIPLIPPIKDYAALLETQYDITDTLKFTAGVRNSRMWNTYPKYVISPDNVKISTDNPFLLPSIKEELLAAGQSSFLMGRLNSDISSVIKHYTKATTQLSLGLEGSIGTWHWTTRASYGRSTDDTTEDGHRIKQNWDNAVDAVIDPTTNLPVCRIYLSDPSSNCVPINIFGYGNASARAIAYVTGAPITNVTNTLKTAAVTLQGEPWEMPAGFVSVATGLEWRSESQDTRVTELMKQNAFDLGNSQPLRGSFNVKEAFGEVLIPLVADKPALNDLAVDIAGRLSNYSTTGSIKSWKVGFVDDLGAGFKSRLDLSRDIRAPNISELFAIPTTSLTQFVDPVKNVQVLGASISGGNQNLKPEVARTLTAGLSWSPPAFQGLAISADYFKINAENIINGLGAPTILQQCALGNALLCSRVTRDADGNLVSVSTQLLNVAEYKTDGVDLDMSYQRPVSPFGLPGVLRIRALGTYTHDLSIDNGVTSASYIGNLSSGGNFGVPRWKGVLTPRFDSDSFSLQARVRYISSGYFDRHQVITNNEIGNYFYYDLGGSYKFGPNKAFTLSLNIDNVTNKLTPPGATSSFSAYYDAMGRYYTLGFRVNLE